MFAVVDLYSLCYSDTAKDIRTRHAFIIQPVTKYANKSLLIYCVYNNTQYQFLVNPSVDKEHSYVTPFIPA